MSIGRDLGVFHQLGNAGGFDATISSSSSSAHWNDAHANSAGYQEINGWAIIRRASISSLPASARIWKIVWYAEGLGGTHGLDIRSGNVVVKPYIGATNISVPYARGTGDGGQQAAGTAATQTQGFQTSNEGNPQSGWVRYTWTGSQSGNMNTGTPTGSETGFWPGTVANDLRMYVGINADGVFDITKTYIDVYAYLSGGGGGVML